MCVLQCYVRLNIYPEIEIPTWFMRCNQITFQIYEARSKQKNCMKQDSKKDSSKDYITSATTDRDIVKPERQGELYIPQGFTNDTLTTFDWFTR